MSHDTERSAVKNDLYIWPRPLHQNPLHSLSCPQCVIALKCVLPGYLNWVIKGLIYYNNYLNTCSAFLTLSKCFIVMCGKLSSTTNNVSRPPGWVMHGSHFVPQRFPPAEPSLSVGGVGSHLSAVVSDGGLCRDDLVGELKAELQRFLASLKDKRKKISHLQEELSKAKGHAQDLRGQLDRAEKSAHDSKVGAGGAGGGFGSPRFYTASSLSCLFMMLLGGVLKPGGLKCLFLRLLLVVLFVCCWIV